MPSMQRLQKMLGTDTFTILGVNMAEDVDTINNFISNKVNITFPILLDTDGSSLKRWQVFAFPTSYLIDKKGKIRFALFGSVEWDSNDKVEIIKKLINE
jgi:peroxiredoxin